MKDLTMNRRTLRLTSVLALSLWSCGSPPGELVISVNKTRLVNDGSALTVSIAGSRKDGTVGSGKIQLSASTGKFSADALVLDSYGTATTQFTCDKMSTPSCLGAVELSAEWNSTSPQATTTTSTTITVVDAPQRVPQFVANGCERIGAQRPVSTGSLDAPKVATVSIPEVIPGQGLAGSLAFEDPQGDEASIIVQLGTESAHWVCPLTPAEKANRSFGLSRLLLESGYPNGVYLMYFTAKDSAGNVGGYSVATLSVGAGEKLDACSGFGFQLMGSAPSGSTEFYTRVNGKLMTYGRGAPNGERLTIVYRAALQMDVSACGRLRLMSRPTGGAVGWDNCLLIEARATSGGPVSAVWSYCSNDTAPLYNVSTGSTVRRPARPTVAGMSLVPRVPSPDPFGFESGALDILPELPAGLRVLELSMYVLDWGAVGSTTEVWLVP